MRRTKIMWATLAGIAIMSSFFAGLASGAKLTDQGSDFFSGYFAAKTKLAESGVLPSSSGKITALSGSAISVKDNKVTVSDARISANPLDDQGPARRTISITEKTAIVKLVPLTASEMTEANKRYQADLKAKKSPVPPSPFSEKPAKLEDIKTGTMIAVEASDDIRYASDITANKISFH